jgi:transcriptional regulator with XRE-family HTH domain
MQDVVARVGAGVRRLRESRGLTQAQLAEAAGMSTEEVSRLERGRREPRIGTLQRLAEAMSADIAELFAERISTTRPRTLVARRFEALRAAAERLPVPLAEVVANTCGALVRALESYGRATSKPGKEVRARGPARKPARP